MHEQWPQVSQTREKKKKKRQTQSQTWFANVALGSIWIELIFAETEN